MKKILLAIHDDFARKSYAELLKGEHFLVFETNDGQKAFDLAIKETPDIIVIDLFLSTIGGLQLMEMLQQNLLTKKIPVIFFSQIERETEKEKAMDLGAKDFIIGSITSPREVVAKIKIHLGFQKAYHFSITDENLSVAKEIKTDLGYFPYLECPRCGSKFELFLIRDLSKGKDYFKLSFSCPNCGYTE